MKFANLPSIPNNHCKYEDTWPENIKPDKLVKGLCCGVNLETLVDGFPTFKNLSHEVRNNVFLEFLCVFLNCG